MQKETKIRLNSSLLICLFYLCSKSEKINLKLIIYSFTSNISNIQNGKSGYNVIDEFTASSFAELVDRRYLESIFNGTNLNEIEQNLQSFKMLKDETFITSFTSFLMFQRGYLNEVFEKFILEAHQHGIIEYCYQQAYRFANVEKLLKSEPKVLTMYMLSAGFYIWLGSICIACVVFVCEHLKFYIEVKYGNSFKTSKVIMVKEYVK